MAITVPAAMVGFGIS